jgi:hypothetical protein
MHFPTRDSLPLFKQLLEFYVEGLVVDELMLIIEGLSTCHLDSEHRMSFSSMISSYRRSFSSNASGDASSSTSLFASPDLNLIPGLPEDVIASINKQKNFTDTLVQAERVRKPAAKRFQNANTSSNMHEDIIIQLQKKKLAMTNELAKMKADQQSMAVNNSLSFTEEQEEVCFFKHVYIFSLRCVIVLTQANLY